MPHDCNRHWNLAERLHPVDLFVYIQVPAGSVFEFEGADFVTSKETIVRAKRETFLEKREHPRVYICEDGAKYVGEFKWAYH
jgi:hypothetical protein